MKLKPLIVNSPCVAGLVICMLSGKPAVCDGMTLLLLFSFTEAANGFAIGGEAGVGCICATAVLENKMPKQQTSEIHCLNNVRKFTSCIWTLTS